MALDNRQWKPYGELLRVTGTEHHSAYRRWAAISEPGVLLEIQRDPTNAFDTYAIKVLSEGEQIGWIHRQQNRRLLERLDEDGFAALEKRLVVTHHRPQLGTYERLTARLELAHPATSEIIEPACIVPWSETGSRSVGACANIEESARRYKLLRGMSNGVQLDVDSTPGRTSVTLIFNNQELAWLRKLAAPRDYDYATWGHSKVATGIALYRPAHTAIQNAPEEARKVPKQNQTHNEKETTMALNNTLTTIINANKSAAQQGAYLEAGRIANNKVSQLASKSLPLMVRGYADTAAGRLVLANLVTVAVQHLRPNDPQLRKLTEAMTVSAYQELIGTFNIEGYIDSLLDSPEIKGALGKLGDSAPVAEKI